MEIAKKNKISIYNLCAFNFTVVHIKSKYSAQFKGFLSCVRGEISEDVCVYAERALTKHIFDMNYVCISIFSLHFNRYSNLM